MLLLLTICFLVVVGRVVHLQVIDHEFLYGQGEMRTVRLAEIPANRGQMLDRNGEPLAVSAPVVTLWVNPREVDLGDADWPLLAALLGFDLQEFTKRLTENLDKEFLYLQRQIAPELGGKALKIGLKGLYTQPGHKRYYPSGEVAAHVVGMTNIDERGQEGLELAFDHYLSGIPGQKKVLKDRRGNVVDELSLIRDAKSGHDLQLSIDLRLQTIAYRELKSAVQSHQAKAASLVLLDIPSGEVLAMVNQPSYNPNNRGTIRDGQMRNRAVTDVFEPGSTIKPLSLAAALQTGEFLVTTQVDTSPGFMRVNGRTIRDQRDYGKLSLESIITKSSNVGISRVALKLGGNAIWEMLYGAGFGQSTGIEYPGEAVGSLPSFSRWPPVRLATLSYGYGMNATLLQLAQSYMAIAGDGKRRLVTLLKDGHTDQPALHVMPSQVAKKVQGILAKVVLKGGTGVRAQVMNYRVGGKTGTVHSLGDQGYEKDDYSAVFAGFAPLSKPRLVLVIVVHSPQAGEYYGGEVAAPVFSRVMANSLRLMNITPDRGEALQAVTDNLNNRRG